MNYCVARAVVWELSARLEANIFLLNNLAQRGYLTFAQGNGSNIVFDATRTVRVAQKARIDQGGF